MEQKIKQKEEIFIGKTLKKIREKKGVPANTFATVLSISPSTLSKIENDERTLSAELLIKGLSYLNVSFEEFNILLENSHFKARAETKNSLKSLSEYFHVQHLKSIISKAKEDYAIHKEPYFLHIHCMLSGALILDTTKLDYEKAREELKPIKEYLLGVETWFEYEIGLFSNCYYIFSMEEVIQMANDALVKLKHSSLGIRQNELTHNLFLNLARYALANKNYYNEAIHFAEQARKCRGVQPFYTSLVARSIQQIAYYKLGDPLYNQRQLEKLLKGLELLDLDLLYDDIIDFLKNHDMPLEDFKL